MVDKAAEGAVGAPFELDVERGKIAEFARATLSENRAYFEGDRPLSPPTFLTTMFFWEARVKESNPWHRVAMDQQRGMHAEQEYIFHGPPPRAGTRLVGRSRIASIFEKAGRRGGAMTFVVMVTEFRDEAGRLVAEARLTGVEPAKAMESAAPSPAAAPAVVERSSAETAALVGSATQSKLGPAPAPRTIAPVTRTDVVRYQGASGDMNPVHHDEPFARSAGYEAPLVVGMFQAGVLASWAVDWLGAEHVRSFKVRWKEQVWPGDVLTFSGAFAREFEEAGERRVELELACTRQTGGVAVQGWATFAVC
jgi:acyl dehydratase